MEFSEDTSRMLAETQYHWLVNEIKGHADVISELELTGEESTVEVNTNSYFALTGRNHASREREGQGTIVCKCLCLRIFMAALVNFSSLLHG